MATAYATSSPFGSDFSSFFQTYFVDYACKGYNIYNTIVYGIIFAIAVFAAYKILKKLKLQIDRKFLIGIFPFIIMGSVLRVFEDSIEFSTAARFFLLCSPLIYFLIFFIALFSLLFAIGIERVFGKGISGKARAAAEQIGGKRRGGVSTLSPGAGGNRTTRLWRVNRFGQGWWVYWKIWFTIGIILDIIFFAILLQNGIKNPTGIAMIVAIAGAWALVILSFYKIREKLHTNWFNRFNAFLLGVHMFDASTTFVALQYFSYYEQHVASNFVIDLIGPAGQFLLKLPIVLIVLYFLERELPKKEDENMKNFFKVAILILGLAPGLRNFLRIGLGV